MQNVPEATEWCDREQCGQCQDMPTRAESVCCRQHDIINKWSDKHEAKDRCIINHPGVNHLMEEEPLEIVWKNFRCYHRKCLELHYFVGSTIYFRDLCTATMIIILLFLPVRRLYILSLCSVLRR